MKMTTIAFADDDLHWHSEILFALKDNSLYDVLFHVWNGYDLLFQLKTHKPEILIVDFFMPILCGNEAIHFIRKEYSDIKILGISVLYQQELVTDLRNMGMNGFALKEWGLNEVLTAIEVIKNGNQHYKNIKTKNLFNKETDNKLHEYKLSPIEVTILRRSAEGKSARQIGTLLSRNYRTIEGHLDIIKQKLNSSKISEAITKSISLGIIPTHHSLN